MQSHEIAAGGSLAGRALGSFGTAIRDTHLAISGRVFRSLGPSALPVQRTHDAISALAYGSVALGLREAPRAAGSAAALRARADAPSLADTVGGAFALSALNAAAGDRLEVEHSPLTVPMQLRAGGCPVDAEPAALAHAYPDATPRIVVFLHGLGGNEDVWRLDPLARDVPGRLVYGDMLAAEIGVTPVYVRYNTGRRISDNGRDLASLLDHVVAGWPVTPREIAIVGHSMGGLVARSALHVAGRGAHPWLELVRTVVCLGSPHGGAPLERGANLLGRVLQAVPETRPWGEMVDARSAGIKDLRRGTVTDDEDLPHVPPGVVVHTVSACVTADRDHLVGRVVGDILVQETSARGTNVTHPLCEHEHLDSANHWTLLSHPDVAAALIRWIGNESVPER